MAVPAALLLDLDGVLYEGDRVVAGAAECVRWLAAEGIPHRFVTNTTSRPRAAVVDKLAALGCDIDADRIQTPAIAAAGWLRAHAPGRCAAFVPAATLADLSGIDLCDAHAQGGAASVVIGDLGEAWDYPTLNRAFRLLMAEPAPVLVALGMTRYWRAPDGLRLDAGPFVRALEYAAGVEAVVLGKPAAAFFEVALAALGVEARDAAMVGDDIAGDVNAAQRLGMTGILVRTGKYRPQDLDTGGAPDAVLDSIAALPAWYRRQASA